MNLRDNDNIKTMNIFNIVEQLNNVTEVINGSDSGNISDVQLKNLNKNIDSLKNKLSNLEIDVNKYIDETELENSLSEIKNTLSSSVNVNDFNNSINNLNTTISTINGKLNELITNGGGNNNLNLDEYVKSSDIESKVNNVLKNKVDSIETNILNNINSNIENKMNSKITELDIDNRFNNTIDNKLNTFESSFNLKNNSSLNSKFSDFSSEINNSYVKIEGTNSINSTNLFNGSTSFYGNVDFSGNITLPKLSSINSDLFKLKDNELIKEDDDNNILIGINDKNINFKASKLLLNGVELKSNSSGVSDSKIDELNTKIENNKNRINDVDNRFSSYTSKTDFTSGIDEIKSKITELKSNTGSSDLSQINNNISNLSASVNSLNSQYSNLNSYYQTLSNQYNNLGSIYARSYELSSLSSTVNSINNSLSYYARINNNNTFSGTNKFEDNKLYVGNVVVRPVKTIFEGKMNILNNSSGGTARIEKFNYASYVNGYEYNCIMFYVCDDNLYNTSSSKFYTWNGGIKGIIDTYLMPKNSVYVSNQYVENDITKSFRVMVDDYNKVILGFYNGLNYSLSITKIVIF